MILQETIDVKSLRSELSDADFATIQKLYHEPIAREDVFAFPAKIIDSEPTNSKRVWTAEYLKQNVPKFVGAPLAIDHSADSALMGYGECFASEYRDGAIHGKFYIPLVNETNKTLAETIQAEWAKGNRYPVSLRATARNTEKRDGLLYVKPSEDDRILEISIVSAAHTPGCQTCMIGETAEPTNTAESELVAFAEAALTDLRNEYCRLQAFALGVGISKHTYQEVADSVSPLTLKVMVEDLKRVLAERQKTEPKEPEDPESELTARLRNKLESIRKVKGA
ncbi:MAG TPA: hypothetical protein PKK06_05095 [Phycisphaerae bacterium]|nr:hypothetical protein [Phycisphaerae bacterium]